MITRSRVSTGDSGRRSPSTVRTTEASIVVRPGSTSQRIVREAW